jgi:hypothetical protein
MRICAYRLDSARVVSKVGHPMTSTLRSIRPSLLTAACSLAVLSVSAVRSDAASIAVPNFSFELQQVIPPAVPTGPQDFVTVFVDSWQKPAEPAYYTPTFRNPALPQQNFGIDWFGTSGAFLDVNPTPYANRAGAQAGYVLDFNGAGFFQDSFGANFQIGQSYKLTLGVFGKNGLSATSSLSLGLYYLNGASKVSILSTPINFSTTTFNTTSGLAFVDFSVNLPTVQASDAWAGKNIGVELVVTTAQAASGPGNWDFDNVRLEQVPEPASAGFLALGLAAVLGSRRRQAA